MARRESVNSRYPLMGDDTLSTVIREFLSKTNDELHMSSGVDIGKSQKEAPLQAISVRKILLVSSLYDSFIFEEGGGLADALYAEYSTLKLIRAPPVISRVSTLKQALDQISSSYSSDAKSIDLVICFLRRTVGNDIWTFFESIRKIAPRVPVLLLASNTRELSTLDPRVDNALRLNIHKTRGWEQGIENIWTWPFLWQGDFSLIFAMIKSVEDRVNFAKDVSNANVRVILVVEDNVQFYSSYLPIIYKLVFRLTADVMRDAATMRERVETRLKRPKILLANSYEEAMEIYTLMSANMLGLITDVGFHRDGVNDETAGLALTKAVKAKTPHLPILVQSSEKGNEAEAVRLGASFLLKSDKHLLSGLREFMETSLGFGPFRFLDEEGKLVREAPTLVDFAQALVTVPNSVIKRHLEQSHFRTWFAAHNRFEIAEAIAKIENITVPFEQKKQLLLNAIFEYRRKSRATVVSEFDPEGFAYDSESAGSLQKLGSGSLGGKGHGLAFLNSIVETYHIGRLFPQLSIYVPRSIILATGIFDDFMHDNDLYGIALSTDSSDEAIVNAFVAGNLREDVVASLGVYLSKVNYPLSVRSSSVFEDAMDKPYAGIYDTFMLPNNNADNKVRLEELVKAIKMVYASTYKHTAQAYEHSSGTRPEEAKMAVVIQQLAGHKHSNNQFFPTFAGVAGSYDVYAKTGSAPTQGYCAVALGLGGTVVNGGYLARFSPGDKDIWKTNQTHYLSLKLDGPTTFNPEAFALSPEVSTLTLPIIKNHATASDSPKIGLGSLLAVNVHGVSVNYVGVTDAANVPIPEVTVKTPVTIKQMTLDELIKNDVIPLSQMVSLLFQVGSAAMSCPIEMEFAVDFEAVPSDPEKVEVKFALLQMRAMAGALKQYVPNLSMNDVPASGTTLCYSRQALGHCLNPEIKDIVFVSRSGFNPNATREIAQQIGQITQKLHAEKRPYILLGPGRWGTATPNLGIPVTWQQICGAACIVETAFGSGNSVPSQGTHFFQNITSFDIPYFTINKEDGDVDYAWLEGQKVATSVGSAKHVALDQPLQVVVDGISRCGVVMLPERSYQVFVGQANAFLDMANLPCA